MSLKKELKIYGLCNLRRSNLKLAISRLNEAFDDDPCIKYLIGSDTYDYNKAKNIHKYSLNIGLLYGSLLTTSDLLEGISIWLHSSRANISSWMFIRAGGLSLVKTVRKDFIQIAKHYGDYSMKIHNRNISVPHWYLFSI